MLKPYKTISIIYGGSGARYASQLNELIVSRSEELRYPLVSKIVMENVLTGDLLVNVIKLFTDSEFSVIFLTADDRCCVGDKTFFRVRQNVLLEMGMAIFRLGTERCILLSDFDPNDRCFEIPSDLKGMDIKYFNEANREQVFEAVLDKILQMNSSGSAQHVSFKSIPRYDHLLDRKDYFVDYQDIFASGSHTLSADNGDYLKSVLTQWKNECAFFTHYEERCLYFLERICFIPMFGRHKWVLDWCLTLEQLLTQYTDTDIGYCGMKKLNFIRNLAFAVSAYTRLKLQEDHEPTYNDYEDLLNQLVLDPVEDSGVANPLVGTTYYDYMGLLYMCLYEMEQDAEHLNKATECFEIIMEKYVEHVDMSLNIWAGFVGYNLARCYIKQFNLTKDRACAEKAQNLLFKTCIIRKRWLGGVGVHSTIRNAMSYEYFVCKIDHINSMKLMNTKSDELIAQELKRLEGELESYMTQEEQLERLCYIQSIIADRISAIDANDTLGERML